MSHHSSQVDLSWIPLGADATHVVQWSGRAFEAVAAAGEHRARRDLYHSALEVTVDGRHHTIEMTPAWGPVHDADATVATGPVGSRAWGRSRFFRYEIHRSRDGAIPDIQFAIDSPRRVSNDRHQAERVLELVAHFPTATWGRDELDAGEMWNSNSLTAWLLARSGHAMEDINPPGGGRAPGWSAGVVVARRYDSPTWAFRCQRQHLGRAAPLAHRTGMLCQQPTAKGSYDPDRWEDWHWRKGAPPDVVDRSSEPARTAIDPNSDGTVNT